MELASIIRRARFTKMDVGAATEGLCGVFALALQDALRDFDRTSQPIMMWVIDTAYMDGKRPRFRYQWRHSVVKFNYSFYDIRGEQTRSRLQQDWQIENKPVSIVSIDRRTQAAISLSDNHNFFGKQQAHEFHQYAFWKLRRSIHAYYGF